VHRALRPASAGPLSANVTKKTTDASRLSFDVALRFMGSHSHVLLAPTAGYDARAGVTPGLTPSLRLDSVGARSKYRFGRVPERELLVAAGRQRRGVQVEPLSGPLLARGMGDDLGSETNWDMDSLGIK
jgi:hypothetical protein